MLYVTQKNGKKRKAEEFKCRGCGESFLRHIRQSRPQQYCNRKCYNKTKENKVEFNCSNCGKKASRHPSKMQSRHGFYFCSRECKEFAQSLKGDCAAIRPAHYGTSGGREGYKKMIAESRNPKCAGCGEKRKYLLRVHHKNGDSGDNHKFNLEIVCGNCHIKRHLKKVGNSWVYNTKTLTPREFLKEV